MSLPIVFASVINQTPEFQMFKKWWFKTYYQSLGFETLFPWEEATEFNMKWRKKHNIFYKTGDAGLINGLEKKIEYTQITYQWESIDMDSELMYGRTIGPIEKGFVPDLTKMDIKQYFEIKANYKRMKIMSILQQPNAIQQVKLTAPTDEDTTLKFIDDLMDKVWEINANITNFLVSANVFRMIRKYAKLNVYSDKQVNEFVDKLINPNMITTVEGISFWFVPKQYEYNASDGSTQLAKLLNDNTYAIGWEIGNKDALALRHKVDTPLRAGPGSIGSGSGSRWYMEAVDVFGGGIREAKKLIIGVETIQKQSLTFSKSNFTMYLNDDATKLDTFNDLIVKALSTQQGMWNITLADIDIFEADGTTPITDAYLVLGTTVNVVVKAKAGSLFFKDQVSLYIELKKGL